MWNDDHMVGADADLLCHVSSLYSLLLCSISVKLGTYLPTACQPLAICISTFRALKACFHAIILKRFQRGGQRCQACYL